MYIVYGPYYCDIGLTHPITLHVGTHDTVYLDVINGDLAWENGQDRQWFTY